MAWTTPQDVLVRWQGGGEPDADDETLAVFIQDAEDDVLRLVKDVEARISSGELPLNRVQKVVARVVIRAYKTAYSPYSSFSQATGPFSNGGTFDSNIKKYVALTKEDISELSPKREYTTGMTSMGGPRVHPDTFVVIERYPSGWLG